MQTYHAEVPILLQVSSKHAILDEDVEVAPIYRSWGMVEKPIRLHENHDQHMEQEATRLESYGNAIRMINWLQDLGSDYLHDTYFVLVKGQKIVPFDSWALKMIL